MAKTPANKLSYRIVSSSGEEANYPASELQSQSPQAKGWQSTRFCDYPQEIILQLSQPSRVRLIQILSHQCKVSSKIELLSMIPNEPVTTGNHNVMNPSELKFRKLGYFFLNTNEKSNYLSRELKTVYVDIPVLYIKLLFHKCHINTQNIFNQVGIIACSIFGDGMTQPGIENMGNPGDPRHKKKPKENYEQQEFETQFDQATLERLRALQSAKEHAERDEDYREAKKLKEAIEKQKLIGTQISKLEERKEVAVRNEDYDSAIIIKREIEKLRNAVYPSNDPPPGQPQGGYSRNQSANQKMQQQSYNQYNNQPNQSGPADDMPQNNKNFTENTQYKPDQDQGELENNSFQVNKNHQQYGGDDDMDRPPIKQPGRGGYGGSMENSMAQNKNNESIMRAHREETLKPYDDQPIPTMKGGKGPKDNNPFGSGGGGFDPSEQAEDFDEGTEFLGKAEAIASDKINMAEPLVHYQSEGICKGLFSKNWNYRENALKLIADEILRGSRSERLNFDDQAGLFVAIFGACSNLINDKISQVGLQAMRTITTAIDYVQPPKVHGNQEYNSYLDGIILAMMVKCGDSKTQIKELALDTTLKMATCNNIGANIIASYFIKTAGIPKVANDFKHLTQRQHVLSEFVKQFGVGNQDVPLNPLIEFAIKNLENSNNDVRVAAHNLIVECYKVVGSGKITPLLGGVKQIQLDMLMADFNNVLGVPQDDALRQEMDNIGNKKKVIYLFEKKQTRPGIKGKKLVKMNRLKFVNFVEGLIKTFWKVPNLTCICKNFSELKDYRWKECPMLTTCKECALVTEISSQNPHQTHECENKRNHRMVILFY